jgi:hypothetical protein
MAGFANDFLADWQQQLSGYSSDDGVEELQGPAAAALQRLIAVTGWIQDKAETDEAALRGAATHYLRLFALAIVACLWVQVIASIKGKSGAFYDVKRKLARFYMQQVLPETESIATTITEGAEALADINVSDLTG